MQQLNGFPYEEIHFGADGLPVDPTMRGVAPALSTDTAVTDLLILCHGFMEDIPGAESLYNQLTASMKKVGGAPAGLGVLGMTWPSEEITPPTAAEKQAMSTDADSRARFVSSLRAQLPAASPRTAEPGDGEEIFRTLDPETLFDRLGAGVDKVEQTVDELVNLASYYRMKARTTLVADGLVPILTAVRHARSDLRIHLVGHSFGGRVMSAALASGPVLPVASVTLLEGAFTQFGFAVKWDGTHDGLFRVAVTGGRCTGPLTATYSDHDETLRVAYALASRLDVGSQPDVATPDAAKPAAAEPDLDIPGLGGPHDIYGAIGANGALRTPEARWLTMPAVGQPSPLVAGAVCNLNSSAYISSHSAVTGPEPAQTVVYGMRG